MEKQPVTIQVFECKQESGYIVRLTVLEGDQERIARYPCPTYEEAEAMAVSMKNYVEMGCDLSALLPEADES